MKGEGIMRNAIIVATSAILCVVVHASASACTLTNLTVRSEKMDRGIPVSIVLPADYDAVAEKRPEPRQTVFLSVGRTRS